MKSRLLIFIIGCIGIWCVLPVYGAEAESRILLKAGDRYPNYRIPGLVATANGTLLAVAEARLIRSDWAVTDVVLIRSTDGGETWSRPRAVAEGVGKRVTVNNPTLLAMRNGTVYLFYCEQYGVKNLGGGVYFKKSTDDGLTWSEAVDISSVCAPDKRVVFATGPTHGIETSAGTLIVPVWMVPAEAGAPETAHHPSVVSSLYSRDGGRSWQLGEIIAKGLIDPSETVAVELSDGTVLFNMRNETGTNRRAVAFSPNGYEGWTVPVFDETLIEPVCNAGMTATEGMLFFVNPAHTRFRRRTTVRISFDDGKTWPVEKILTRSYSGYSDIAVTTDGNIHILLETKPGQSISYFRIPTDRLTTGNR